MAIRTKNRIIIPFYFVLLLSFFMSTSLAQGNDVQLNNFNVKFLEFDQNNNAKLNVDISLNQQGNIKYVEEYYLIKNRYPVYVSSNTYYDGNLNEENSMYNASFNILREQGDYSLVKGIILFNGNRILDMWLTKNKDFIDNTASAEDSPTQERAENIEKFEIRENSLLLDAPTTFQYSTLDVLDKIHVIGTSNYDSLELKVNLFKDTPNTVYKPNSPAIVYKYFEITSNNNRIKEIIPEFKIGMSWINDNNISSIIMLRWNDDIKDWEPLITRFMDNDSTYVYFNSSSPSLSTFAIVGFNPNMQQSQSMQQPQSMQTLMHQESQQPQSTQTSQQPAQQTQNLSLNTQNSNKVSDKVMSNFEAVLIAIILILLIYTFKIRK